MKSWYENDQLWEDLSPFLFSSKRWENAQKEIGQIIRLLELMPNDAILDLACGPGIHLLEFARQGFVVTGVDRCKSLLDKAKMAAHAENLSIDLHCADVRDFIQLQRFDAAINIGLSFGFFEDIEDDKQVLANLFTSLKPGGKLLIDVIGKEAIARFYAPKSWHKWDDNIYTLERLSVDPIWEWMNSEWIVINNGICSTYEFRHRLYSASELIKMLDDVGFFSIMVYGDFDGRPYSQYGANRLIITCSKAE